MNPTSQDTRQPLPSLLTVYRPVEEYWDSFRPAGGLGPDPSESLDRFDAFLIHRVLELIPGLPVLADAAVGSTGGASSLIGLGHPHVRAVLAVTGRGSIAAERAVSAVRSYIRSRPAGLAPLDVISRSELPDGLSDLSRVVILADARGEDADGLSEEIGLWLERSPDALVLVLGLGQVGECPAIASLVRATTPDSPSRFWLMKELGEALASSHLGVVARRANPHVADVLLCMQQYYTGNYAFLDLLRQVNQAALRDAKVDADVMRHHPLSWALTGEIEELKRAAREAKEQAASIAHALNVRTAEVEGLRWELQATREQLQALSTPIVPPGLLSRARTRLAPTPVGKAWRLSKRARRKLSPTPLGKAYRLSKRVARVCLSRGH